MVIDGRPFTWEEFGDLLSPTRGWSFRLTLGEDATITTEGRAVRAFALDARARQILRGELPRCFVIDLDHYPIRGQLKDQVVRDVPSTDRSPGTG